MADSTSRDALKGWKSVAGYFGRDVSTVMRWAAQRGLPVRRLPGEGRSSVYALPDELAAWLASNDGPPADPAPATGAIAPVPDGSSAPPESRVPAAAAVGSERAAPAAQSRRWQVAAVSALIAATAGTGLWRSRPAANVPHAAFADLATERAYLAATYDQSLRTPASLERARAEFGAIIARDPAAAPAYAALGETYLLLREYSAFPTAEAYRAAAAAAKAATALDPDLLAAHRVRAFVAFWSEHDIGTARAEFARALALDPRDAQTWHWYATALSANGEQAAALNAIREARRLEPQSTPIAADYGLIVYLAGRREEGLATLRQVAAEAPNHMSTHQYLADLALMRGDGPTYLAEAAIACRLRNDGAEGAALAEDRAAFARGGEPALLATIAARRAKQGTAAGGHVAFARILALQGKLSAADAQLRLAAAVHEPDLAQLPGEIMLQALAGQPAYDELRSRPVLASAPERPSAL